MQKGWSWKDWLLIVWVAVSVAVTAVTVTVGWTKFGHWLDSPDAPAWVQAIGSIAAIVAAIFIGSMQNKRALHVAEEMERWRIQRKFNAVGNVFLFAERACIYTGEQLRRWTDEAGMVRISDLMVEAAQRDLDEINLSETESYHLSRSLRMLRNTLRRCSEKISEANRYEIKLATYARIDEWIEKMTQEVTWAREAMLEAQRELMEDPQLAFEKMVKQKTPSAESNTQANIDRL